MIHAHLFYRFDFDNDGYITPEDIRIMISYMPFQRNILLQTAQGLIENKGIRDCSSPLSLINLSPTKTRQKIKEGLYEENEVKNVEHVDRINY